MEKTWKEVGKGTIDWARGKARGFGSSFARFARVAARYSVGILIGLMIGLPVGIATGIYGSSVILLHFGDDIGGTLMHLGVRLVSGSHPDTIKWDLSHGGEYQLRSFQAGIPIVSTDGDQTKVTPADVYYDEKDPDAPSPLMKGRPALPDVPKRTRAKGKG